ncbi:MAG TPA: thiol:disulfide interchange protein DsbA/DsbL, partial [Rheinheimera sp.]|nr:thiol:disulfide interchange protein DsbA/DsbL [Rheinheimera sp.]
MKKLFSMLAVLLLSSSLHANSFNEGEHYEVISNTPSATPQVMEFFSYFCPHCYNFEPIAKQLKAQLPADVPFKRSPVAFMGGAMGPELQKALALAEMLKVDDQITPALFAMIHQKRTPPRNREELKSLFISAGISAEDFDNRINSMPVLSAVAA